MFIGHFAVGLAAKRWAPRTSLGLLLAAPLLLDLLWPAFSLIGVEHFRITPTAGNPFLNFTFDSYPWSHSLAMALVWGGALAGIHYRKHGNRTVAGMLMALVVSHWVLDAVTHRPDLPLWPGGPVVGLGLWNSVAGTIAVESTMFLAGVWIYFASTRSSDRIGRMVGAGFALLVATIYAQSLFAPPPPLGAERLVSLVTLMLLPLVPLAAWMDRHREAVPA